MCGIIAYVGESEGTDKVINGLKKLEYRGYDSWGIAVKGNPALAIHKEVGKISDFTAFDSLPKGSVAMGHTRWATHGAVTKANAHPHTCCYRKIAVVHNGIVENFQELKENLSNHVFVSQTDTEIIAHLIEDGINSGLQFEVAFMKALQKLEGRFAIVAMSADSDYVVAARKGSPLVVGKGKDGHYIASDVLAFADYTKDAYILDDGDVAVISKSGISFSDFAGTPVERPFSKVTWSMEEASLGSFDHYMIKEIMEQKSTILKAIDNSYEKILDVAEMINQANGTFLIGCGTAGKVGLVASYIFSKIAKMHVNPVVGSEFPSYHDFLTEKTLLVCISQSGETADTLEAIEVAKRHGCKIVSIVNVDGSSMVRMSDEFILCKSGPERAVCSTKVTTAQIAILTLLAFACAGRFEEGKEILLSAARKIDSMLDKQYLDDMRFLARKLAGYESMYIIGRGLNYPMALEAAIKMQEVPYIHAEGFAGGELKHGPIALIQEGTPCIALVANDDVKHEILINALEIKSRGGYIIGVSNKDNEIFDYWIPVPDLGIASPIANIIPIQLLSYYSALEKELDPDKPRNLAKSVTVK
jgi:glucosamine--fructose-6-phosphate aminotransferase (isomerizing)